MRPGVGDGSFGDALPLAGGLRGSNLELIDLDGDELLDLLAENVSAGVSVWPGLAGGGFGEARPLPAEHLVLSSAAAGDVNGDAAIDLVFTTAPEPGSSGFAEILAFLGDGSGGFAPPVISTVGLPDLWPARPVLGDLDGDLALDLSATVGPGVLLMRGDGSGAFGDPFVAKMRTLGSNFYLRAKATAIADFDEDGRSDVVAVLNNDFGDNYFRVLPSPGGCLSP